MASPLPGAPRPATRGPVSAGLLLALVLAACGERAAAPPATSAPSAAPPDAAAHADEIEAWRARRLERLTSETGWLTVVGLHWLRDGENPFGASTSLPVTLPGAATPDTAGTFVVEDGRVFVVPAPGAAIRLGEGTISGRTELAPDDPGPPDVLWLGDVSFFVIRRDDRLGIRVRDPSSEARRGFTGIEHFPVSLDYRVVGTFEPYDRPRKVPVPTVLGTTTEMDAPGLVRFVLGGRELTLEPVVESPDDDSFFFIFRDATTGKETYGGGRFLYAERVASGPVVLDFNEAYNPPCAFTAFATCPLPPRENALPVRIEAGDKSYAHHELSGSAPRQG